MIDPCKFRIIKDSWNKTDKQDSRNMVKALWVYIVTGEFGIPTVYKPDVVVRDLRKLFSQYQLLNRQIRVLKNSIQAIVVDNGITLPPHTSATFYSLLPRARPQKKLPL